MPSFLAWVIARSKQFLHRQWRCCGKHRTNIIRRWCDPTVLKRTTRTRWPDVVLSAATVCRQNEYNHRKGNCYGVEARLASRVANNSCNKNMRRNSGDCSNLICLHPTRSNRKEYNWSCSNICSGRFLSNLCDKRRLTHSQVFGR